MDRYGNRTQLPVDGPEREAARAVTVAVVEDSPTFARGLAQVMAGYPFLRPVGTAHDAATGLALVQTAAPQVTVVDLRLRADPETEASSAQVGLALVRRLCAETDTHPIVLTGLSQPSWIRAAAEAGAWAFLDKDADPDHIARVVWMVGLGYPMWTAEQRARLEALARLALTPREQEVLALVAAGLDDRAIARRLGVGWRTVGKHLENIRAKLGVKSRTQAVARAREWGLLPVADPRAGGDLSPTEFSEDRSS